MTSVREAVRASQTEQFGEGDDALRDRTIALYGSIDALTTDQRLLLVNNALSTVHSMLDDLDDSSGGAPILAGIVALAGYAVQTTREDSGATSTGDSAVTAVLTEYRSLVKDLAMQAIDPELRATASQAAQKVSALVDDGVPLAEAVQQIAQEFPDLQVELDEDVPEPKREREPEPSYGMYL